MSNVSPSSDFLKGDLAKDWLPEAVSMSQGAATAKNTANSPCCPKGE